MFFIYSNPGMLSVRLPLTIICLYAAAGEY